MGNTDEVEELLKGGANVNQQNEVSIALCIYIGFWDSIQVYTIDSCWAQTIYDVI